MPQSTNQLAALAALMQEAAGVGGDTATKGEILAQLTKLGGGLVQEDNLIFQGSKFVLPENYRGRLDQAAKFLTDYEKNQETETNMSRTFNYRPWDVAHAFQAAVRKLFGVTGQGVATQSFFGPIPPEMITVATGHGTSVQVPWGDIALPVLSGTATLMGRRSSQHGLVGAIAVLAPKKHRSAVDGLFVAVEEELKTNSIYRGKAFTSETEPTFLDLSKVRREDVVYGDEVMRHLEANLWAPIQHADALRKAGQPIKRAVLLEGPYGTGKSLAGYLTAKVAEANGWTFIFCKPGSDLNEAMQTAKLYAPAVVFFEDIDVLQSNNPEAVSKLLDSFDGVGGKGQEVIAVLTTNNREKIHKGMLRPGRLDALIHIAELDAGGVERLIKSATPDNIGVNVDYEAVFEACKGYLPAFVKEVAVRAVRYAMVRSGGMPEALFTEDYVHAATSLREQFNLMSGASEVQASPTLDAAIHNVVAEALESMEILDDDGDRSRYFHTVEVDKK